MLKENILKEVSFNCNNIYKNDFESDLVVKALKI